ncbi:hypothetical protein ACFYR1_51980 [Streptomyces canus]|uniref:hypothetical protein n=1 Tax=Streptomyces canus TaxID=58343 RepID=UPI0036C422AD
MSITGWRVHFTRRELALPREMTPFIREFSALFAGLALAEPATTTSSSAADGRAEANLDRLRRENADLRRTLALYEEAIRQLALENDALRDGAAVVGLPTRTMPALPAPS